MKPFDLERAKAGDPLFDINSGGIAHFVGTTLSGDFIGELISTKILIRRTGNDLRMIPKKRTMWVNLYPNGEAFYHHTQEEADDLDSGAIADRIGNKSYPVEVEE